MWCVNCHMEATNHKSLANTGCNLLFDLTKIHTGYKQSIHNTERSIISNKNIKIMQIL